MVSWYDGYHDSNPNGKMQDLVLISLNNAILKCNFAIIWWITHTVRMIYGQHKPTNASILKVFWDLNVCFVLHDNHKLQVYYITIMDLCDMIITLSIILHITYVLGVLCQLWISLIGCNFIESTYCRCILLFIESLIC